MRLSRAVLKNAARAAGSTHFGFRDVPLNSKQGLVGEVFARVASRYDLMNDLMSGFLHRTWKNDFVAELAPSAGMKVLDCAGGTGDIAFRVVDGGAQVTVLDVSAEMLQVGREKAMERKYSEDALRFIEGNAENLPFADNSFDAYTISFGMRNVPRPAVAVDEAIRVLKPGGRFLMLEFAQVRSSLLRQAYDAYSFKVLPVLGEVVAGDRASYQYLVESIRKFPKQAEFLPIMQDAGLIACSVQDYSQGLVACYSGFKRITEDVATK